MAVTVLSGTSGALYYKPAGTTGTFGESDVNVASDAITIQQYLNLKVGDQVKFRIVNSQTGAAGSGTLPAPISSATTYFVLSYTAATGVLTVSTTAGGTILAITDDGTLASPHEFEVYYADYSAVGQVQNWSFEINRAEIDVTTIGQTVGQYAPFKAYIPGFADGNGSASVYVTNEDSALSNRMVEDVLQRQQVGCAFKLYTDKGSTEALSRSISMDAVLLTATLNINPDDAQMVEITFRPTGVPTFDFSTTA
jgi:cold shock CspA family protein